MVCWFTSTRGRTSQTRMESIPSATGLRCFWKWLRLALLRGS
jgi:hypothetical protein